jgi:hypothetical protein
MRTGRVPGGPIQYPALGAFVGKELETENSALPSFVSIAPFRFLSPGAYDSGFLGPRYAPLFVGENAGPAPVRPGQDQDPAAALKVQDLDLPSGVKQARAARREGLLGDMEKDFTKDRPDAPGQSHSTAYQRALTMMRSEAVKAFDLTGEDAKLRERYGKNLFGQGCLLARRLVERGVPFVEVTLAGVAGQQILGWDTHQNNFESVKRLSQVLDPAWATLMDDLKDRGLLDTTTIVWMGEFGRTPRINNGAGRDHWPQVSCALMAGGGMRTGQVIGATNRLGEYATARPTTFNEIVATIYHNIGLDPMTAMLPDPTGRPQHLTEQPAMRELV